MQKERAGGSAAIILAAFLWATAYVLIKDMTGAVRPGTLMTVRFLGAAAILFVYNLRKIGQITKDMLRAGMKVGVAVFLEYLLYTIGIGYTSVSKASFIINAYIIFLPFVYLLIRHRMPEKKEVLASALCMAGICLIMCGDLAAIGAGDTFCLLCAFFYALHIVLAAPVAKQYDAGLINLIQMTTVGVLSLLYALVTGDLFRPAQTMPLQAALYLALVCTVLPFFLSLYGMRRVSTTTSGILLSFESVIATVMAVIVRNEPIYWQLIAGGAAVVLSFAVSELWPDTRHPKKGLPFPVPHGKHLLHPRVHVH